jgi:predicted outer membrane repeat protein
MLELSVSRRRFVASVAVMGVLTALVPLGALPVRAATFNVPGDFPTIQEAIDQAAATPGEDTISIGAGTFEEHLIISDFDGVELVGAGAASTVIGFPSLTPETEEPIVSVVGEATALFRNLTITGGDFGTGTGAGGGVRVDSGSNAFFSGVDVRDNAAIEGGGVYHAGDGVLDFFETRIEDNFALVSGGGLYVGPAVIASDEGPVRFEVSTLEQNTAGDGTTSDGAGGGVYTGSAMTFFEAFVVQNSSTGPDLTDGGGIYATAPLTLTRSTVSSNTASAVEVGSGASGGGIWTSSGLVLDRTSVVVNQATAYDSATGGGIVSVGVNNPLNIDKSTIAGNSVVAVTGSQGGGIAFSSVEFPASIDNSTINGNSATGDLADVGGGLAVYNGSVTITRSTLTDNDADDAGLLWVEEGDGFAEVSFRQSILAGNQATAPSGCEPGTGTIASNGDNFLDAEDACTFETVDGVDLVDTNGPNLGPLQFNGGDTITRLPNSASPVIDAYVGCGETFDQRGVERPQGEGCDIGSVELEVVTPQTLQDLIDEASAGAVVDVPPGTYFETITIGDGKTLRGDGSEAGNTVINGSGFEDAVATVEEGGASFENLTLADGVGGILIDGTDLDVSIANVEITGNSGLFAHGIRVVGDNSVSVVDSLIFGNDVTSVGGGIYNNGGQIMLTNTSVTGNSATGGDGGGAGGGIFTQGGEITITGSSISANTSNGSDGGGIANIGGTVTVNESVIASNVAEFGGGALFATSTAQTEIVDTTISQNTAFDGGGIYSTGTLVIDGSTIESNTATSNDPGFGGGIYADGTVSIVNSTIDGNSTAGDGGGIWLDGGVATLNNVTLTDNTAVGFGGAFNGDSESEAEIRISNTLSSGNGNGEGGPDCGVLVSLGHNVLEGPAGCLQQLQNSDIIGDGPLGPLQNNGGPTETRALLPGHPAIDAGAISLDYPDFGEGNLGDWQTQGFTDLDTGGALLLASGTNNVGSAFLNRALPVDQTFEAQFQFRITPDPDDDADGITFTIADSPTTLGGGGGLLGISVLSGIDPVPTPVVNGVSVEFDTWPNGLSEDANDGSALDSSNHVGIDVDGDLSSVALNSSPIASLSQGVWTAWIEYDASATTLDVWASNTGSRPASPTVSAVVDIAAVMGSSTGYFGFTGATGFSPDGDITGSHRVLNFSFANGTPCEPIDQRGVSRPIGAACDSGAFEAEAATEGTIAVTEVSTNTSSVEAGYAVPLARIPAERLLVGADSIAGAPLGAIGDLSASPLGAIPLGAIPLGAIGGTSALGQTLLSEIPITGGWETLLEGTAFAGRPLQTLTLDQVSVRPDGIDPLELAELDLRLGDIRIGDSALADLSIAALTLGDVPLNEMGLSGSDSVLDIETSGGSIAAVPLGAIQLGAIPLGAIGSPAGAPLGAIPLGAIPLGAIPLGAIDSPTGAPLGAIGNLAGAPLGAIPLGAIPLGAIQLGAIPLGAIQLGAIPLGAIGGGCGDFSCPAGTTDDSTVADYLNATGSSDLESSPLGAIQLGAIQLGAIQLGAIQLGAIQLGAIPLGAIDTSTPLGAIQLGAIPLGAITIQTVCAEVSGPCDGETLLADYAAGLPAGTDSLASTPLGAIQLGAIPLGAIEFTATSSTVGEAGLNGVPLGAIEIAGVPLGAIRLDSIDLTNSPLGAIQLGAIPLGAICGSTDAGLTLAEAAALGSCDTATLADLGAALETYDITLAAVLDYLTFGFLGQITELDSLTYGEIVVSILLSIDFPWEDLPLDEIETRDVACDYDRSAGGCTVGDPDTRPDLVRVDVDVDVTGGSIDGTLIDVTIPAGWIILPGSAEFATADSEGSEALSDPTVDEEGATFAGVLPAGASTISFAIAPDFEVGPGFTVSARAAGDESSTTSGPITVTEGLEFGDVVANAQQVAADTLYVGYIRTSGDEDWWDIPAPAPGFRVAVYLSNLAGDVDTFVYRPESTPLGVDTNSRSIPLGTVPISDDEFDFDGTDTQSPEVLGDSVVDEPAGQVLGDSSTNRGTEDEYSEFFSRGRDSGGDYSIQVAGFQGATSESPYVLRVKYKAEVPTPTCSPRVGLGIDTGPIPAIPADVDSIFLVNWDRMEALYGPLGSLPADFTAFANSTVGGVPVNGVVIPIGSIPGVGAGFTAWDANPCDADSANVIVDKIVSYIQGIADERPSLRHVTVVGSDEIVPFARLEDETIVANESTYTEGFADNALYGSQFTRHYLSDAPYGDLDPVQWLDRFAYLPDLGVGRLVETPDQIAAAITTFQGNGGLLDPQTAATAGYDFLTDGAEQVKSALSGLTDVDPGDSLLSEIWSREDLANTAYGVLSGPAADLISPNAHYDHYRALPAIGNLNQTEDDLFTIDDVKGLGSTDLASRIIFTVGCHSALNVPNLSTNDQSEDWAEVYGDFRAIYIGNTGYGYGDFVTVALSEQVMANLAANLGNGQTIGQNLSQAKQDQFGKAGLYGVYDLKAIEEATLYGLPFWRVDVNGALPITSNGSETGPVELEPETGLLAAPFSKSPAFAKEITPDGAFWTADEGTQFLHWRPIQPKTEIDATQDGLVATGVVLTDLETRDEQLGDPVFGRPNTSDFSGREPEIEFRDSIFPTSFASVGTSDLLNPERSDGPTMLQQRVNLLAGQYVGPLGIQRLFDQIDGSVYYSDDPAGVDWTAPVITTVDADVVGNQATFLVEANDPDSNVSRVVALYRSSAVGATSGWTSIDLIPVGGQAWAGGGTFDTGLTPPLDYIVQVVNGDGVVAVSTFKGEFHKAAVIPIGGNNPPTVGEITGPTGPIEVNTTADFSAPVSDDGPAPPTVVWDFGDGTTASSSVANGETSVSHIYSSPGVYRVQLVVVDGAGAVGQAVFEFAVVYDPNGGFVTGGGWIDSPAGAYPADPSLTGKANFGFVSKYKKGKSTPDGNTTFQFKAADLKFKSTSYDWMVIAGKKAQYKGSGTINGSGDYSFMITAIDAALTPSTAVDLFRIKIWDKSSGGGVIYDNQLGASDNSDPTTAIGGGSIVIHDGKKRK